MTGYDVRKDGLVMGRTNATEIREVFTWAIGMRDTVRTPFWLCRVDEGDVVHEIYEVTDQSDTAPIQVAWEIVKVRQTIESWKLSTRIEDILLDTIIDAVWDDIDDRRHFGPDSLNIYIDMGMEMDRIFDERGE